MPSGASFEISRWRRARSAPIFSAAETGQAIREEIARIVPFYDGIQHFRKTGDAFQYGGRHLCENGMFPMPDVGALHLSSRPRAGGRISRQHPAWQDSSIPLVYAETDPLNGAPRDAVLMSRKMPIGSGWITETASSCPPVRRYEGAGVSRAIASGNLQVHWPEGNVLIRHGRADRDSGVPDYNAMVRVERAP